MGNSTIHFVRRDTNGYSDRKSEEGKNFGQRDKILDKLDIRTDIIIYRQNVDNLYVSCTHRHIFYLSFVIMLVLLSPFYCSIFYHFSSSS